MITTYFKRILGFLCDGKADFLKRETTFINTQRSNIRRKLELKAEDNLYDFIVSKIKEVERKG